jgi:hypothetical protein
MTHLTPLQPLARVTQTPKLEPREVEKNIYRSPLSRQRFAQRGLSSILTEEASSSAK